MSGKQRPERLGAAPYGKCQVIVVQYSQETFRNMSKRRRTRRHGFFEFAEVWQDYNRNKELKERNRLAQEKLHRERRRDEERQRALDSKARAADEEKRRKEAAAEAKSHAGMLIKQMKMEQWYQGAKLSGFDPFLAIQQYEDWSAEYDQIDLGHLTLSDRNLIIKTLASAKQAIEKAFGCNPEILRKLISVAARLEGLVERKTAGDHLDNEELISAAVDLQSMWKEIEHGIKHPEHRLVIKNTVVPLIQVVHDARTKSVFALHVLAILVGNHPQQNIAKRDFRVLLQPFLYTKQELKDCCNGNPKAIRCDIATISGLPYKERYSLLVLVFRFMYLDEKIEPEEANTAIKIAEKLSLDRKDCKSALREAKETAEEEKRSKNSSMLAWAWLWSCPLCICIGPIISIVLATRALPYCRQQGKAWHPYVLIAWGTVSFFIGVVAILAQKQ